MGCKEIQFSFAVGERKDELSYIERKIRQASQMESVEKMKNEIHKLNEQLEEMKSKFQLVQRYLLQS